VLLLVSTLIIRIDSTYVRPNIKVLNRGGLFRATVSLFLRNLAREMPMYVGELDRRLRARYDESLKIGYDPLEQAKPAKRYRMLTVMAREAEFLVGRFRHDPNVYGMETFKILGRLVREQVVVLPAGEGRDREVLLKDPRDVAADSLQSPFDTGATYRGGKKKVKGRKIQLAENCSETRKSDLREPFLSLVVYARTEGAHVSDAHAIEGLLEFLARMNVRVKFVLGDNARNTPENRGLVKAAGGELVTSVHGGLKDPAGEEEAEGEPRLTLKLFRTDERGAVTECPQGQKVGTAEMSKAGDAWNVHFDWSVCRACRCRELCPVKIGQRRGASMRYTLASLEAARNRLWNERPENVRLARQRNGAEALMSQGKRGQGIGRLRVRGTRMVEAVNFLKILGLNIMRLADYLRQRRKLRLVT
ncbi:MAG: transposase, partial [Deltaproteobacteria bacterium]|jgi:hypothetical protein|nr:transposase [Deltaproteobacteria bacterium]